MFVDLNTSSIGGIVVHGLFIFHYHGSRFHRVAHPSVSREQPVSLPVHLKLR
jgi:hypothetical protein